MAAPVKLHFDQGWVTARDRADLRNGELQTATGGFYKPGDPTRLWKIGGRAYSSLGGTPATDSRLGGTGKVVGIYLAQYDSGGTDYLYALNAVGGFYRKTPAQSGVFSNSGLTAEFATAASALSGVHYNNVHYLCNGTNLNVAALADGSVRRMGVSEPLQAPTVTTSTVTATTQRPASAGTTQTYGSGVAVWQQQSKAFDADATTFAYVTLGKSDTYTATAKEQDWTFGTTGLTTTARLEVVYRLTTGNISTNPGDKVGSGGNQAGRFSVQVIIKFSLNNGSTFATVIVNSVLDTSMSDAITIQYPIPDANYTGGTAIVVRASGQLLKKGDGVSLRIADIRLVQGGRAAGSITPTTGFQYAVTEYDAGSSVSPAQEGPPSGPSLIASTVGTYNLVTVTLPTAAQNSRATHWRIYRTPDGGSYPTQAGRVAEIPISQTTWADAFVDYDYNFQAPHIVDLVSTSGASGTLFYALNQPPPNCKQMFVHRGRIIGIPATSDRALAFSEAGLPESWPDINSDNDFPLQEGDRLICGRSVGDLMILFCSTTVISMMDVAAWIDGQFRMTQKATIRGAPGVVGQDAVAVFTAGGEPMAAWVSYQGIYITDGHSATRISDEHEWATLLTGANLASSVLHWDRDRQCLVFAYDATAAGTNNRFALLHMAQEHGKENGQPKWTGPHYGSIASMASGMVSGVHRLWSGHVSDGTVYLENNGTTDASQSYSSTQVPLIALTARLYGDSLGQALNWREWGTYKARLRHTAAGGAETVSVLWTTGRDSSGVTQSTTKTPSIVGQQGNEFYVGLGGEWAEVQLTHTGSAAWGILDLTADAIAMGRAGRVA